jgi:hypothetical protein
LNLKFNFVGSRYIYIYIYIEFQKKWYNVVAYYISWTSSLLYESHYVLFLWIPQCSQSVTILSILTHVFHVSNIIPTVVVCVLILLHFLFFKFCCNHLIYLYVLYGICNFELSFWCQNFFCGLIYFKFFSHKKTHL